ncbi:hypothetical protein [Olivibacter sitiensis]|uniref:hypothetical protein n=1 Tax=Olivibacter sitiensis TaxID=376470 RepID=UPI0004075C04|nr:hypothetical protein [Olivibacter sitiensis]
MKTTWNNWAFKAMMCIAVLFIGMSSSKAQSYQTGAGLMIDVGEGVTLVGPHVKHFFAPNHAGEGGILFGSGLTTVSAMYQYNQPIEGAEGLQWYLGLGANVIFEKDVDDVVFGIVPAAGLDYKIGTAPIDIFADWRPKFLMYDGESEFLASRFSFGLRFTF